MRDPKAIRKAIMTAKSIASLVDPKFARVPLPDLGVPAPEEYVPEHSPAMHEAFGVPMPKGYAAGGDVEPYQDPETSHISEWNWRPLEDVRSDLGYMREIPSHVLKFGDFMDEIARKASEQGLTPRDLIKAYTITRSSIQRRAAKTDKVRQAGLPLPDFHDEMIRPEGAFGEWLHTPAGQAYLDAAERGQVHHGAIQDAVRVMAPFGKHEKDIPDALAWAAAHLPGNESRVSELIHAGRLKASHPAEWRDFTSGIRGIGPSKSGFYASLLGRGDQPTLDARQIILHTGRPTKEATRFLSRKGGAGGVEAVNRLTARQEAMGLELPEHLSPYYQHLAHHAVWDQAGGDETTHEDVMRSMRHAASGGAIMPHEHWIGEIFHRLDGSDAEHYASGGGVDDENPYTKPDDLGLYSHAAVAASNLPKTGTPQQMKEILLRQPGVKPSELHWGEYDYAFGDKPEVSRDEIAKQMWMNIPSIEEKVLRERKPGELSAKEISDKHYKERQSIWDEDLSPAEINQRRREMRERHAAERASAWHHDPYHESYTIPDGENYREILLKHGNGDMFKGVGVHFGGEPDILTSLMVKDRQDREGDKVLHVDELQSDWAQQGRRQGFSGEPSDEAEKRLMDFLASLGQRTGMDVTSMWPHVAMEAANALGERDMLHQLAEERDAERKRNKSIIKPAPYVTKTEDWVDLGLKRALREAAEKGYDKLAWSPGSTIADRYNLAKHVNSISHEKNDDGTYNLSIADPAGGTFFKQDNMSPEKVSSYLGKGVAEKIFAGEGITNEEIRDRESAARKAHLDFLDRLAENDINNRISGIREEYPDHEYSPAHLQMMRDIVLQGVHRDPAHHARAQGLEDEYQAILNELKAASDDYYGLDRGRDYRHLKTEDIHVGEKWPFEMYDRMIPKRALRLAKMHDPDAQLEKSTIEHDDPKGYAGFGSTDLHAIRITPKMRESILKKGFPAYAQGGEVEGYADGGEIDPELFKQYMKRIHSPLNDDPESVRRALQIAGSYRSPIGMETGVGSLYNIKQSLPAKDVRATIGDIPGIKMKKPVKKSWEDFYEKGKGGVFINMGGDLSNFGRLTHINDKELAWPVDLHAGTKFMLEPNPKYVWGNAAGHSTAFENKIRAAEEAGKDAYGIFSPMGPSAVNSSHNMFDALMAQIPNAGIDKKHLREFDAALKRGDHLDANIKSNPKKLQAHLDALKAWPGLENAKEASEYARPEAGNLTGTHRTMIVKFMDKADWLKKGFPEVGVTRAAITDPELKGVGGNKIGHRIVKLSSQELPGAKRAFEHSTYPTYTGGEYVMDVPLVQRHYAAPDVIEQMIRKPTKAGQVVHPYSEDTLGRATARKLFEEQKQMQPINQRMLDSVMMGMENQEKYGFKKGGTVRKAMMIAKGNKKK